MTTEVLKDHEMTEAQTDGNHIDNTAQNKKKRKTRKKNKKHGQTNKQTTTVSSTPDDVEIEYVSAKMLNESDPHFEEFQRIFGRFTPAEDLINKATEEGTEQTHTDQQQEEMTLSGATDEQLMFEAEKQQQLNAPLSKKAQRKLRQVSVAQLKQFAPRPDVVEVHDVTAADPKLLVYLKSYRNTIPVPRHWSQKRKYLQGKRGIEKPPFKLPEFIRATGIQDMRENYKEKQSEKTAAQKSREAARPKLGKMDIDYSTLHDAFFKYQTKPKLTIIGDLYYEGKEFELRLSHLKPGFLSERLRNALGMPAGAPPPWLINMQRHGPPPSYPTLKIPGLNAPIPEGASWGYHPGGWGRPPVDETGRPLYGDVFRRRDDYSSAELTEEQKRLLKEQQKAQEQGHWGEFEEFEKEPLPPQPSAVRMEEPEAVEEKVTVKQEQPAPQAMKQEPAAPAVETLQAPDSLSLRKKAAPVKEEPVDTAPKPLYQVVEQQEAHVNKGEIMGSTHKYVLPGQQQPAQPSVQPPMEESRKRKREEEEDKSKQDKKKKKYKF